MVKIRKQKDVSCALLVSYDPYNDGYEGNHGWINTLLNKGEVRYGTWYAKDAWRCMPVYIYEKEKGIVACAQIVKPKGEHDGIIGACDKDKYPYKIQPEIKLDKLRELGIIKRNPPRDFQYLYEDDYKKIESLLEPDIEEIEEELSEVENQ